MIYLVPVYRYLRQMAPVIVPLGLWAMLWSGVQTFGFPDWVLGYDKQFVFTPSFTFGFFDVVRGILPPLAFGVALVIMLAKLSQQKPMGFRFFGPLGLAFVYGLVGIVAAALSPEWKMASYWAMLYLSVPLVLWAIVWGADSIGSISRLVNFNWFLILTAVGTLMVIALFSGDDEVFYAGKFDLGPKLLSPSTLWQCEKLGSWFVLTSGVIRSTGVGRFAAIAAIVCFSMLWRANRWQALWLVALYLSLVFLMTTGARTSILGLAAAAPLIAVLHWGKKAVIAGAVALAILAPVALSTGVLQTFLQSCILKGYDSSGITELKIQTLEPAAGLLTAVQPTQEQPASIDQQPSSLSIPTPPAGSINLVTAPPADSKNLVTAPPADSKNLVTAPPADSKNLVTAPPADSKNLVTAPPADSKNLVTAPPADSKNLVTAPPADSNDLAPASSPETNLNAPDLGITLRRVDGEGKAGSESSAVIVLPAGKWSLKQVFPTDAVPSKDSEPLPVQIKIPPGNWTIESPPGNSTDPPIPTSQLRVQDETWVAERVPSIQGNSQGTSAGSASQDSPVNPEPGIIEETPKDSPPPDQPGYLESKLGLLPLGFLQLSGRTLIWAAAWEFIKQSPILGYGFLADRLVLGTHIHNAFMHAMIQTGIVGTVPFVGALLYGWMLVLRAVRRLNQLPEPHKILVIQTAGILMFLSVRGIPESTGAFFSIDWLLLAPLLLYVQIVTSRFSPMNTEAQE